MSLRDSVGNGLTIHVLVDVPQLNSYTGNCGCLLRSVDALHVLYQPLRGDTIAVRANRVANLGRKALVCKTSLRNALLARGRELCVHLSEHRHNLVVALARVNSERDSIGAGNAIVLGSHRATPICPRRDYLLAKPCVWLIGII